MSLFIREECVLRYVNELGRVVTVTPSSHVPDQVGIYRVAEYLTDISDHFLVSYEYLTNKTRPLNKLERVIYGQ